MDRAGNQLGIYCESVANQWFRAEGQKARTDPHSSFPSAATQERGVDGRVNWESIGNLLGINGLGPSPYPSSSSAPIGDLVALNSGYDRVCKDKAKTLDFRSRNALEIVQALR